MFHTSSSSYAHSLTEDISYISRVKPRVKRLKVSNMATMMEAQLPHQDDTLMGLQELDSHLAMFDSSDMGRESSTPGAMSTIASDELLISTEHMSQTITVDSPIEMDPQRFSSAQKPDTQIAEARLINKNRYKYVYLWSR